MKDLTEHSWDMADKIEILAGELHKRVQDEIEKMLKSQVEKLGERFPVEQLVRKLYPDDPETLCSYEYEGKPILGVKIGPNGMSIMFDVPEIKDIETFFANPKWIAKIETQKGEVHV